MAKQTLYQRYQKRVRRAVHAVRGGMSYRKAVKQFRVPKSTVYDALQNLIHERQPAHRCTALTAQEENSIVDLLTSFSDRCVPLTKYYLLDAVKMIVNGMTPSRRLLLPFKCGCPSQKFVRAFMRRHKDELHYLKPLRQEAERFAAVNVEVLTQHFATFEKLVEEHGLDASRIYNLDECGITPCKETSGRSQTKRFTRRNGSRDVQAPPVSYENRITLMPSICADGSGGPCLWVFKGKTVPYREVLVNGTVHLDTLADHLPRHAVISMREQGGGVDMNNFREWALHFISSVKDLTRGGKKVLLIFDGYRSHMSLPVLRLFREASIIVYAIPAHASGKTQPLDVVGFSSYKGKVQQLLINSIAPGANESLGVYEVCDLLTAAYNAVFNDRSIIEASFRRAGAWPVDASRLLSVPRPRDSALSEVMTVEEMVKAMERKRRSLRAEVYGKDVTVTGTGYVDTSKGAVLTSDKAMELVEKHHKQKELARLQKEADAERRKAKAARRNAARSKEADRLMTAALHRRAAVSNMTVEQFEGQCRSIEERRAVARLRTTHANLYKL